MIKIWRPDRESWGNRWPAEERLNELVAEGWTIVAVLPADPWSSEVPTVILRNRARWRSRHWQPWWRATYWHIRFVLRKWWPLHG